MSGMAADALILPCVRLSGDDPRHAAPRVRIGGGAEFRAPMARAVIGGLITSAILTLIVASVVYNYLDDALRNATVRSGCPPETRLVLMGGRVPDRPVVG